MHADTAVGRLSVITDTVRKEAGDAMSAVDEFLDDEVDGFDDLLSDLSASSEFRAAYDDANTRSKLLLLLQRIRRETGLTQSVLAELMGTTQSAVSDLEAGTTDPRLSTIQRYARALNARLILDIEPAHVRTTPIVSFTTWASSAPVRSQRPATRAASRTELRLVANG